MLSTLWSLHKEDLSACTLGECLPVWVPHGSPILDVEQCEAYAWKHVLTGRRLGGTWDK